MKQLLFLFLPALIISNISHATEIAIFAGGCFWCMEPPFDKLPGVISTTSGYTGGKSIDPTYKEVSAGSTGHLEAVEIKFDEKKITYDQLLETYWHNIDPLDGEGQFCDKGPQYKSAVFFTDDKQKVVAKNSLLNIKKNISGEVKTEILAATKFYPAEDYHQDYYKKNPIRYKYYRSACGRDNRLKQLWSK